MLAHAHAATYRVVQLTDCHLYADSNGDLLGLNTLDSLEQIKESIKASASLPDVVLATGDLVHDGSAAGYRQMARILLQTAPRQLVLPGNHDHISTMKKIMGEYHIQHCGHSDLGNWRLILLDSQLAGEEKGRLSSSELERLHTRINDTDRHILIFLHHQPVPIGSQWIDEIGLENAAEFWDCIDQNPQVKGVVWGHVHQSWNGRSGHIELLATPSTCIQFAPNRHSFEVAMSPPGWRSFELMDDGHFNTEIHHLPHVPPGISSTAQGYI